MAAIIGSAAQNAAYFRYAWVEINDGSTLNWIESHHATIICICAYRVTQDVTQDALV